MNQENTLREYMYGEKASEALRLAADNLNWNSSHYLSHLGDSRRVRFQSGNMLKKSAELYLMMISTYKPIISNPIEFRNNERRALGILQAA